MGELQQVIHVVDEGHEPHAASRRAVACTGEESRRMAWPHVAGIQQTAVRVLRHGRGQSVTRVRDPSGHVRVKAELRVPSRRGIAAVCTCGVCTGEAVEKGGDLAGKRLSYDEQHLPL